MYKKVKLVLTLMVSYKTRPPKFSVSCFLESTFLNAGSQYICKLSPTLLSCKVSLSQQIKRFFKDETNYSKI